MDILIRRGKSTINGTPGKLTITDSDFTCDTLELNWHNNKTGISCTLPDQYLGWIWFSPTLRVKVIRLEDKHGRKNCLIHNGNFAGDASEGLFTQIHGCTEVGRGYTNIKRSNGVTQWGIQKSKVTLAKLIETIGTGPHFVTYVWDEGCEPDDPSDHQQKKQ